MDPKDIEKLAKCLRDQGDKVLTSQFKFTVTGELLRSLNDSFSLIIDENELVPPQTFQVTKPNNAKSNVFRELMFIYDFIQKTLILKLTKFLDDDEDDTCVIDISKFRNLTTLELQRIDIKRVVGLQILRSQLQEIVAERCLKNIKDLIMFCAGDNSNSFIWNSLKRVDFSYNNLERVDNSFEFTPYLQHLNLSHNKIFSISALVWLPNLKVLNLSFNQLTNIPKLHFEASRRLQVLIMNSNLIEDVSGIVRLDALLELDLSENCLLDHAILLPLCTLNSLRYLNMIGNPLAFHPKHRSATCRYLSKNAAQVQFQLDGEFLTKHEKSLTGSYENYYPLFGHRMTTSTSSSRATPSTKSIGNTPDNSSLSSTNSFTITEQKTPTSNSKRLRSRCVEIEESGGMNNNKPKSPPGKVLLKEGSKEHLTTKKEIEELRQQFGNDWLHSQSAKDSGKSPSRRLFDDFLNQSSQEDNISNATTPINETITSTENETIYKSTEVSTVYQSANDETIMSFEVEDEKVILSDPEENEAQFIVVDVFSKEDLFLVVSDASIKERDAMSMRTLTKWGIGTLESVERPRTCIIRMTFDTIRKDKRERQYEMEAKPCQELERMLRDYLSSKPLSEMNQTIYKCLKCNSEFCHEIDDRKRRDFEIKCPCGNKYVIEIEKTAKCENTPKNSSFFSGNFFSSASSSQLPKVDEKVQPVVKNSKDTSSIEIESQKEETLPKTSHSFSSIESAFDSNQSVAGSSVEILSESSQMSHVSSQSSIEVLDSTSRKPSEERKISLQPSLDTIEDDLHKSGNYGEKFAEMKKSIDDTMKAKTLGNIGNVNLTESSSSGSVCESVVTAYESSRSTNEQVMSKVSNYLFPKGPVKPTNTMETSSFNSNPIQYNYEDLTNVDHRVKLYLFQNILEENDEKLVWVVRCHIIEDDSTSNGSPALSLVVMSTKKVYFLKIVGDESDDIQNWLRKSSFYAVDRIEIISEFPDKIGMSFVFKSKTTAIHLLLRDHLLFEKLKSNITSNQIIRYNDTPNLQKVSKLLGDNELKFLAIFKSCSTSVTSSTDSENSEVLLKTKLKFGIIFVTPETIFVSNNFKWACDNVGDRAFESQQTLTQPMSNLVELENFTDTSFTLNFIDEMEDTLEKWKFTFETSHEIMKLLQTIDGFWQKIFCISLLNEDQLTRS